MINDLRFITSLSLLLVLINVHASAGELNLNVLSETGYQVPCRVLVRANGKNVFPTDATTLKTGPDTWFMSDGQSRVEVDDGEVLLRVERGHEYTRVYEMLRVDGETKHTVKLSRWVNMKERGYLTGENHLHVDSVSLAPMLAAEGLDFGTSLTWWRGPDARRPIPKGEGRVRTLESAGHRIPTSIYDAELEYAWGAAYIQNLPAPMPIKAEPGRPNLDYLRHAADAGALVHYQGGWSREVLLDALLGCVHTVNVCNNNFALHRFQPRKRYSNLLEVEGFPDYPDTDIDMMRMNTETYYRLLNCGLRLAAGAGSATGVKEAPVGYNRAYVRVKPNATLGEFNDAWKAGRNFVTNGPMLFLSSSKAHHPGDTISLSKSGEKLTFQVEAIADMPLSKVEIIVNGEVVKTIAQDDQQHVRASHEIAIDQGSWIAARCTAHDDLLTDTELAKYKDTSGRTTLRVAPSRLRFAHTSPIYVTFDGRSVTIKRSMDEGLQILEAFDRFAQMNADEEYKGSIKSAVDEARADLRARRTSMDKSLSSKSLLPSGEKDRMRGEVPSRSNTGPPSPQPSPASGRGGTLKARRKSPEPSTKESATVRVAAISFVPEKFELQQNANRLEQAFRNASQGDAQIAVAPEGALDGYVVNQIIAGEADAERMRDAAIPINGPVIRRFQDLAIELDMCLVFGFAELIEHDVFNCAVFIDNEGKICGKYHKMQLAEGYHPSWWFNRLGKQSRAFDTPYGRCGLMICNDRWNPALARIPVLDGAQFLLIPAMGSTSKSQDQAVLDRGKENQVPVVEANVGVTLVVDKEKIAAIDREREGITFGEITIPPATSIQVRLRDQAEQEFLQWREKEMAVRYQRTMERLESR